MADNLNESNNNGVIKMAVTYKVVVDEDGNTVWYNQQGQLHREGGKPAVERADGTKEWWVNGQPNREGGKPVIEYANGGRVWYVNDEPQRECGLTTIEYANGGKVWYANGKELTEYQAKDMFNKPTSCAGKVVEIDGKKFELKEIT